MIQPTFSPQAYPESPPVNGLRFTPMSPGARVYAPPPSGPAPKLIQPTFSAQANPDRYAWCVRTPSATSPRRFTQPTFSAHANSAPGITVVCDGALAASTARAAGRNDLRTGVLLGAGVGRHPCPWWRARYRFAREIGPGAAKSP